MRHRLLAAVAVGTLVAGALGMGATSPATAAPTAPAVAGAGAGGYNDATCRPSSAHPDPVLLLHGLGAPPAVNFAYLGPYLAAAGYCAFTSSYGISASPPFPGFQDTSKNAADIARDITKVRAETGAARVDLVGHSEGAFLSLYVPKALALGDEIGRVVALAPPTHGTTVSGLVTFGQETGLLNPALAFMSFFSCVACGQLIVGGSAVQQLNDGPIAQPGVSYSVIASTHDEVVTPPSTAFVHEPGVVNHYVQDVCPSDPVGHGGLAFDADVAIMVTNALDPTTAKPVTCSYGMPF